MANFRVMIGTQSYKIVAPNEADAVEWGRKQDSLFGKGDATISAIDLDEVAKKEMETRKALEAKATTRKGQRIEKKNLEKEGKRIEAAQDQAVKTGKPIITATQKKEVKA